MIKTQTDSRKLTTAGINCIILAAGMGTRMNTEIPKALHKIGSKTLISRLIDTVRETGIKDISVVVGYNAEKVKEHLKAYGVKTVKQKRLLGSADAVMTAREYFENSEGDIMVLYTDTPLLSKETLNGLINTHKEYDASCTLLTTDFKDPAGYGRIVRDNLGSVIQIVEETDANEIEKAITEVNIGAYCFKKSELLDALKNIKKNEKKNEFYLTDVIKYFRDKKLKIAGYNKCLEKEAIGINSREDLSAAAKVIRMKKIKELMKNGVTFIDPDTAYIDEGVKIGKDSIIYPSVIIEGDVVIGNNCRIGPFARIRGKSLIKAGAAIGNFVEIVRSKIGLNTRVKHHTYLGDAIVGDNVNIGAGVITANYDGKNKNKTVIKDRAFIGVGAVLIAPVKIGKHALVGAGSVVTKNKNVPDKTIVIGAPARIFKGLPAGSKKGVRS
ncbi:MAG: NTP transferase domain-containing protein [Candidatus Omnitrophica bacterium]|nr:NTP transferase domain-containing protein [Candidatus Omnitrophota bacterium]